MKAIAFFINLIYWLGLFLIPAGISGFIAAWIYYEKNNNILSIIICIAGIITGFLCAEYVRRRYGLNNFWSGISTNMNKNDSKK